MSIIKVDYGEIGNKVSPVLAQSTMTSGSTFSISGVNKKTLIVFTWLTTTSSQIAYNAKDLTSIVGGTATKLGNFSTTTIASSPYRAGTVTMIKATSDTVSFSISSSNAYCQIVTVD